MSWKIITSATLGANFTLAFQAYITYLYEYPLDKHVLESHLSFILSQLDYEILEGRDCALDMIRSVMDTFPRTFVADNCELVYISLAARLINDPEPEIRKKIAGLLRSLMSLVDVNSGEKLLDICLTWMRDEKSAHRRLGELRREQTILNWWSWAAIRDKKV